VIIVGTISIQGDHRAGVLIRGDGTRFGVDLEPGCDHGDTDLVTQAIVLAVAPDHISGAASGLLDVVGDLVISSMDKARSPWVMLSRTNLAPLISLSFNKGDDRAS
jgi:hypothetical protein